jgi:hypothetical protein
LARRDRGGWNSITAADGLAGNSIRFLIEDNEDCLG